MKFEYAMPCELCVLVFQIPMPFPSHLHNQQSPEKYKTVQLYLSTLREVIKIAFYAALQGSGTKHHRGVQLSNLEP